MTAVRGADTGIEDQTARWRYPARRGSLLKANGVVMPQVSDDAADSPDVARKPAAVCTEAHGRLGKLALVFSVIALTMLLCVGTRIHADRSRRIPVVIWETPGAVLAILAAVVWCSAMVLALFDLHRAQSKFALSGWALVLALWGAIIFLIYICALYET
jgi:hypothetical protein